MGTAHPPLGPVEPTLAQPVSSVNGSLPQFPGGVTASRLAAMGPVEPTPRYSGEEALQMGCAGPAWLSQNS